VVKRLAMIVLLATLAGPGAAQDSAPPFVQSEPPEQPAAPEADPAAELPSLPAGLAAGDHVIGDEPVASDLTEIVLAAHPVVQGVMVSLAVAAFLALTIFVHKTVEFALANRRLARALTATSVAPDLQSATEALAGQRGTGADMARTAAGELALADADKSLLPGTRDRTRAMLLRHEAGAAQTLRSGTGLLASIGAVGPFVGLFGTVFGIMNSFLAIAETKTTNLAVVAPGIAEALLATAIGLAAAIPAVLFYNLFSRRLASHRQRLADLATALDVLQSRSLDRLAARSLKGI
jgi:biopolymer transport protein ExbB